MLLRSVALLAQIQLAAAPEVTIGVADGDTLYTLNNVIAVTEDRRGNIYVTQQGVPYVAVFDVRGRRIATLGSGGGGPGEFANPGRVSIVRDSIWIDDFGLRKFSQFSPDFHHVRDVVVEADYPEIRSSVSAAEFAGIAPIAVTDHGFVIELRTHDVTRQLVQPWTGAAVLVGQFPVADLLARFAIGNRMMTAVRPVMVYPFLAARGDRLIRIERDTVFRLTRHSGNGTHVASITPALKREPPSRQWIEAYFHRVVEQFKARTPSFSRREIRRAYEEAISFPRDSYFITAAFLTPSGHLWVLQSAPGAPERLYEIDGRIARTLLLPAGRRVVSIADGHAWAVETDADDVPYLKRYAFGR